MYSSSKDGAWYDTKSAKSNLPDVFCEKQHKMKVMDTTPYAGIAHKTCDICHIEDDSNKHSYHCALCLTDYCVKCANQKM